MYVCHTNQIGSTIDSQSPLVPTRCLLSLVSNGNLGPDYMSRDGPVSRAASVCRDDFQPVSYEASQPG